jgi:cell wall-associated NlpC family hydrolase
VIKFTQLQIPKHAEQALVEVLSSWKGTPYRANHQKAGIGVDCVRFVCGVYDRLYGVTTPIENLPQDIAFHNPEGARAGMRSIVRAYGAHVIDRDDFSLSPGDAVIVGPNGGGPGHVMVAGAWPTLWHAMPGGVCSTGFGFEGLTFSGIVRAPNKETWRI